MVVVARLDGLPLAPPGDLGHRVAGEGDLDHHVLALVEVRRVAEARWHVQFRRGYGREEFYKLLDRLNNLKLTLG